MSDGPIVRGALAQLRRATELACGYPDVTITRLQADALLAEREELLAMLHNDYDHAAVPAGDMVEARAAAGKRATLVLTGEILEARKSEVGAYVVFRVDERWGFGDKTFGLDLAALTIAE